MILHNRRKILISIPQVTVDQKHQVIQIFHILQDVDTISKDIADSRQSPLYRPNNG